MAWEHEGNNNAPCYYIAYNLACAYSLLDELEKEDAWITIALKMNPSLEKLA